VVTFWGICISGLEQSYAVALATATAAGAQSEPISFENYVAAEAGTMWLHGDGGFEEQMEGFKLFFPRFWR
jgi:hypothetical protein